MLCSKMSVDKSPLRKSVGESSLNSSSSSFRGCWAEEMQEQDNHAQQQSFNSSGEMSSKNDNEDVNKSKHSVSQEREISLEFIDGVNEEKFERLVKEDKIKTPFKRRYSQTPSNGSRSDSPNDSNSDNSAGGDADNFKRTTNQVQDQHDIQKRLRYNSYGSNTSSNKGKQVEDDPVILARRQKQIEYGKNTVAYERYIEMVPIRQRTRSHPRTPNKYGKYSRRTFDGLIKVWRKQLHYYDPEPAAGTAGGADDDDDDSD
ncbi:histone RNA hairpin-binding protein isoform X2 [Bactrocera dorsalis]|uniref:Histone RNA hairpin-binding protein isoform X2 n=2 Tax=Bactrocera dorsalis TaxID=27457 RepID=A0A9B2GWQ6_BACDO|nr:histone RNA hairpin-binding protein isoform X2 [Bactrocera dorsalis]